MEKIKRGERLIAMVRMLSFHPNKVIPFQVFCDQFNAAKSSISEDIAMIERVIASFGLGEVTTVTGAAGGVRFRPMMSWADALGFISGIAEALNTPDRALPGGYLYLSDLLSDPVMTRKMGIIMARPSFDLGVDFVLTMETKGIPVAMMTAEALNVPMLIARRSNKVYEGSSVNISYPDGKGGIETMSLARRAVMQGQRALIVDDFMRHGGTAAGMITLMQEFNIEVAGLAFMLAQEREQPLTDLPEWPLMTFSGDGIETPMVVRPAQWLADLGDPR
ncbi:MAG: pur operon repressor [Clostridiales bacterium]|nr:pur operon repressor [Clostridiales bacterium]